jgi:sirohydrochlorin cobaltochelatase
MTGLVIVGHGTRSAAGVDQFAAFVERVRRRAAGTVGDVAGGFIELSRPPLTDAVGTGRWSRCRWCSPPPATARGTSRRRWPASGSATPG